VFWFITTPDRSRKARPVPRNDKGLLPPSR
jgi:hypothetical protein